MKKQHVVLVMAMLAVSLFLGKVQVVAASVQSLESGDIQQLASWTLDSQCRAIAANSLQKKVYVGQGHLLRTLTIHGNKLQLANTTWIDEEINALAVVHNKIFAATDNGLYDESNRLIDSQTAAQKLFALQVNGLDYLVALEQINNVDKLCFFTYNKDTEKLNPVQVALDVDSVVDSYDIDSDYRFVDIDYFATQVNSGKQHYLFLTLEEKSSHRSFYQLLSVANNSLVPYNNITLLTEFKNPVATEIRLDFSKNQARIFALHNSATGDNSFYVFTVVPLNETAINFKASDDFSDNGGVANARQMHLYQHNDKPYLAILSSNRISMRYPDEGPPVFADDIYKDIDCPAKDICAFEYDEGVGINQTPKLYLFILDEHNFVQFFSFDPQIHADDEKLVFKHKWQPKPLSMQTCCVYKDYFYISTGVDNGLFVLQYDGASKEFLSKNYIQLTCKINALETSPEFYNGDNRIFAATDCGICEMCVNSADYYKIDSINFIGNEQNYNCIKIFNNSIYAGSNSGVDVFEFEGLGKTETIALTDTVRDMAFISSNCPEFYAATHSGLYFVDSLSSAASVGSVLNPLQKVILDNDNLYLLTDSGEAILYNYELDHRNDDILSACTAIGGRGKYVYSIISESGMQVRDIFNPAAISTPIELDTRISSPKSIGLFNTRIAICSENEFLLYEHAKNIIQEILFSGGLNYKCASNRPDTDVDVTTRKPFTRKKSQLAYTLKQTMADGSVISPITIDPEISDDSLRFKIHTCNSTGMQALSFSAADSTAQSNVIQDSLRITTIAIKSIDCLSSCWKGDSLAFIVNIETNAPLHLLNIELHKNGKFFSNAYDALGATIVRFNLQMDEIGYQNFGVHVTDKENPDICDTAQKQVLVKEINLVITDKDKNPIRKIYLSNENPVPPELFYKIDYPFVDSNKKVRFAYTATWENDHVGLINDVKSCEDTIKGLNLKNSGFGKGYVWFVADDRGDSYNQLINGLYGHSFPNDDFLMMADEEAEEAENTGRVIWTYGHQPDTLRAVWRIEVENSIFKAPILEPELCDARYDKINKYYQVDREQATVRINIKYGQNETIPDYLQCLAMQNSPEHKSLNVVDHIITLEDIPVLQIVEVVAAFEYNGEYAYSEPIRFYKREPSSDDNSVPDLGIQFDYTSSFQNFKSTDINYNKVNESASSDHGFELIISKNSTFKLPINNAVFKKEDEGTYPVICVKNWEPNTFTVLAEDYENPIPLDSIVFNAPNECGTYFIWVVSEGFDSAELLFNCGYTSNDSCIAKWGDEQFLELNPLTYVHWVAYNVDRWMNWTYAAYGFKIHVIDAANSALLSTSGGLDLGDHTHVLYAEDESCSVALNTALLNSDLLNDQLQIRYMQNGGDQPVKEENWSSDSISHYDFVLAEGDTSVITVQLKAQYAVEPFSIPVHTFFSKGDVDLNISKILLNQQVNDPVSNKPYLNSSSITVQANEACTLETELRFNNEFTGSNINVPCIAIYNFLAVDDTSYLSDDVRSLQQNTLVDTKIFTAPAKTGDYYIWYVLDARYDIDQLYRCQINTTSGFPTLSDIPAAQFNNAADSGFINFSFDGNLIQMPAVRALALHVIEDAHQVINNDAILSVQQDTLEYGQPISLNLSGNFFCNQHHDVFYQLYFDQTLVQDDIASDTSSFQIVAENYQLGKHQVKLQAVCSDDSSETNFVACDVLIIPQITPPGILSPASNKNYFTLVPDTAQFTLYLRHGGNTVWEDSLSMLTIPDNLLDLKGIEYSFNFFDDESIYVHYPFDKEFASLQVFLPNATIPQPIKEDDWQLISIPALLNDSSILSVIDEFGAYGQPRWELYRWLDGAEGDAGKIRYKSSDAEFNFAPGKAFWLKVKNGYQNHIQIENCTSIPSDTSFSISLVDGWNLIANPFAFSLDWETIHEENRIQIFPELVNLGSLHKHKEKEEYDGVLVFEPWVGYFVYVDSKDKNKTLHINPVNTRTFAKNISKLSSTESDWSAHLECKYLNEAESIQIGQKANADEFYDRNDHLYPPVGFGHVKMACHNWDWDSYPMDYLTDFKPLADGSEWHVCVQSTSSGIAEIQLKDCENMPADYSFSIVDMDDNEKAYRLTPNAGFKFAADSERHFKVFAGKQSFMDEQNLDWVIVPDKNDLAQNFPNPFNPTTTIRYDVAEAAHVKLAVYNMLGQEVIVLVNDALMPGAYTHVFDASALPSAIYITRLQIGNTQKIKKMVLIK